MRRRRTDGALLQCFSANPLRYGYKQTPLLHEQVTWDRWLDRSWYQEMYDAGYVYPNKFRQCVADITDYGLVINALDLPNPKVKEAGHLGFAYKVQRPIWEADRKNNFAWFRKCSS